MERKGLGTRSWGLGIKGSRFGMGGWGFRTLLGLAILVMWSATAFAAASGSEGEGELGIHLCPKQVFEVMGERQGCPPATAASE
jgi:hypothetical protein